MLVSSGALVILTAGADPWTWMVMATALVGMAWLALAHMGAWLQRVARWIRRQPGAGAGAGGEQPGARSAATAAGSEGEDAAEVEDHAERGR